MIGKAIRNEIIDVIRAVAKRNHDRLSLPIVGGRYLRLVSDRATLQNREYLENFVTEKGLTSFEELKAYKTEREGTFTKITSERTSVRERITYLQDLLQVYKHYEPYIKLHKEQWELKGRARKNFEIKHMEGLTMYDAYRNRLKEMIKEPDKIRLIEL